MSLLAPRQSGFSLVELIATIILIGILSVVVLPRLFSANTVSGYTVRDELVSKLRKVQLMAMNNADRCYRFSVGLSGYQIIHFSQRTNNLCSGSVERTESLQPLPSGTSLSLMPNNTSAFSLDFNRKGQAFWQANSLCEGNCIQIHADDSVIVAIEAQGYIHAGI